MGDDEFDEFIDGEGYLELDPDNDLTFGNTPEEEDAFADELLDEFEVDE